MEETWLRWEGRIGASKSVAILIGLFAFLILAIVIGDLTGALNNTAGIQVVSVHDLVTERVGSGRYVSVGGTAAYELSYEETENGSPTAIIYPLIDTNSGDVVFIRSKNTTLATAADQIVTVTGMTHSTPNDLRSLIARDMADIEAAGFRTSSTLYMVEGEKPADAGIALLEAVALGGLLLLCVATLFFPTTVFNPGPVKPLEKPIEGNYGIKVTGRLQKLKSVRPEMVFGGGTRKFSDAVANVFTSKEGWLGIYIHYIFTYRMNFIPVFRQVTDWAVVIQPARVYAIQPGNLYGWRVRPAVSIKYSNAANKAETLVIAFEHSGAQAKFLEYLRGLGYPLHSPQFAPAAPTWA